MMLGDDMKKFIKTALWIVLGGMFIMAGGAKLMGEHSQVEHFSQWGYPLWFLYVIGFVEVAGGMCLFIPKTQFYGIVVLSITMVGAAVTHLVAHEMSAFPVPVVLLILLVTLAMTMPKPPKPNTDDP